VPTAFVDQVVADWHKMIDIELSKDLSSLVVSTRWQYEEAMCCLCRCVLNCLGVERPTLETLSLIGSSDGGRDGYISELVLVWSAAPSLEPGDVLDDCIVTRVVNFPLPSQLQFVNSKDTRRATIARWACALSEIADDLPEKEM